MATLELNNVLTANNNKPISLCVKTGHVERVKADAQNGQELLLAIIGLRPLTGGVVCVDGAPLNTLSAPVFRQLTGYAPCDIQLTPDAAIENAMRGGGNQPITTAQWIVEALGLPATLLDTVEAQGAVLGFDTRLMAQPPSTLNAEQRRRLLLATAVARARQLLLVCHPLCPEGYLEQVATQRQLAVLAAVPTEGTQNPSV